MPVRHRMKLPPETFKLVKSGVKQFEFRINDEKRRAFRLGERIELAKLPELATSVIVEITSLDVYKNFVDLYRKKPEAMMGVSENDFLQRMAKFYTPSEERKYGVVAIGIRLV